MVPIPANLKVATDVTGNTCICCSGSATGNDRLVPNTKERYTREDQTREAYRRAAEELQRKVPKGVAENILLHTLKEKFTPLAPTLASDIAENYLKGQPAEAIETLSPDQKKTLSKLFRKLYLSVDDYQKMREETARQQLRDLLGSLSRNPSQESLSSQGRIQARDQVAAAESLARSWSESTLSSEDIPTNLSNRPQILKESSPGTWQTEDFAPPKLREFLKATTDADSQKIQDTVQRVQARALREANGRPIDPTTLSRLVAQAVRKGNLPLRPCIDFEKALQRATQEKEKSE